MPKKSRKMLFALTALMILIISKANFASEIEQCKKFIDSEFVQVLDLDSRKIRENFEDILKSIAPNPADFENKSMSHILKHLFEKKFIRNYNIKPKDILKEIPNRVSNLFDTIKNVKILTDEVIDLFTSSLSKQISDVLNLNKAILLYILLNNNELSNNDYDQNNFLKELRQIFDIKLGTLPSATIDMFQRNPKYREAYNNFDNSDKALKTAFENMMKYPKLILTPKKSSICFSLPYRKSQK